MYQLILSCLVVVAFTVCTFARDDGRYAQVDPELKKWIEDLKDDEGRGCCANADGIPPTTVWGTASTGYTVEIRGQTYKVPDKAVIKIPNRLGSARVWFYEDDGQIYIRCFLPGTLS